MVQYTRLFWRRTCIQDLHKLEVERKTCKDVISRMHESTSTNSSIHTVRSCTIWRNLHELFKGASRNYVTLRTGKGWIDEGGRAERHRPRGPRYASSLFSVLWDSTESKRRYAMCAWGQKFVFSPYVISGRPVTKPRMPNCPLDKKSL